ncbi:MAG: class I tRNA ligase family protein, partial [Chloroflexales bacterium]|nr:class I tRNA ligase family protein [Chloroflexales bacterium]
QQRLTARTIRGVTDDLEQIQLNTAIAKLMVWARDVARDAPLPRSLAQPFVLLLAPFAPHLAEELWERLGQSYSIHQQSWPVYDPALLTEPVVELPVQVDGKVRDRITVPRDAADEAIGQAALASERVQASLHGRQPRRLVVVPGRVVNVVTKEEVRN